MVLNYKRIPKGERMSSRKLLSTFIIFSFFIFNLILATTGCKSGGDGKDKNAPELPQKEELLVTFSDNLWGTVQLDSVASSNVVKLLDELEPSTIEISNINKDAAISGEIKDDKGKKQIKIGYNLAVIDNKVFEGPAATSLFRLAEQEIYSTNQLSKVVKNCKNVKIEADDLNKQMTINSPDTLAKAVKEASQVKDDSEKMVISSGEKYPDYKITIPGISPGFGSQDMVIHLENKKKFYIAGPYSIRVYNSTDSVWNYCMKVLPYDEPSPGSLAYLFTANSLDCKEIGNLNHRKLGIARLLQKGVFQENTKVKDPRYHLTFTFNQGKNDVTLGENTFEYNGKTFKLENVERDFRSLVSAG